MTTKEREYPESIDSTRIARISKGSHVPATEIREMLKYYKLIKELASGKSQPQNIDKKMIQKIAKKFGRKMF